MMHSTPPQDALRAYTPCSRGIQQALVQEQWADVLADALLDGEGCDPVEKFGRGALSRFSYAQGTGLVRRYLRGGIIRFFMRDAYVLVNRPLRELRIHAYLFESGLRVPAPLGACWERRGLLIRGALATHEIAAVDLLAYLKRQPTETDEMLAQCGALIREMHDRDVFHADLQVKNILCAEEGPYLIDFDNARRVRCLTRVQRARNLFRLRRSFEKNGLPLSGFEALMEGYGHAALPVWLGAIYRAKGKLSDRAAGRGNKA